MNRRQLSIVPYWNWNTTPILKSHATPKLSIVPYWNWNISFMGVLSNAGFSQSYLIGIETTYAPPCRCNAHSLNRTLLELKLRLRSPLSASGCSQSYLIGIETAQEIQQNWLFHTLNRTLLELKQDHQASFRRRAQGSQSYLIGIETEKNANYKPIHHASQSYLIGIETMFRRR